MIVQASGVNQSSHYALVRAFDSGTPKIDRWHAETLDKAWYEGHYYSVKAPGLAAWTLPWYSATDSVGLVSRAQEAGDRVRRDAGGEGGSVRAQAIRNQRAVIWLLGLWAIVLPALALLVLVRSVAERFAPGYGTAAAVGLGAATLVLPYSTMLYAHVPAAALALAAYVLADRERFFLAGLAGGLAALVEYPVALIVAVIGVWALARFGRRALLMVAGGLLTGAAPLALYNLWAFGSITHMSYDDVVAVEGRTGHDVVGLNDEGLFGVNFPDPSAAWDLLFSGRGLLVLTPVVAVAVWGLWRARSRVLLAIVAVAFLYNAGYYLPFGGGVPGPRFLVPMLPFVAIGLAVALRERTATTLALLAASAVGMLAATIAEPQLPPDDATSRWTDLLGDGDLQFTLAGAAGAGHGWIGILPFLALVGVALVLAARTLPREGARPLALAAPLAILAAWALVALLAGDAPFLVAAGALAGVAAVVWWGRAAACSDRDRSPAPSTASSTTATPRS